MRALCYITIDQAGHTFDLVFGYLDDPITSLSSNPLVQHEKTRESSSIVSCIHAKNGIWIIHGGTRKITVCSSKFYGVNSNFCCHTVKSTGTYCNFSSTTMNYTTAVFCVQQPRKKITGSTNLMESWFIPISKMASHIFGIINSRFVVNTEISVTKGRSHHPAKRPEIKYPK